MKKTAVYALTSQGARLGRSLADQLGADLFLPVGIADSFNGSSSACRAVPFDRLLETVANNFSLFSRHIFIAATGIVVRAIAPYLKSKDLDPAVVVLDQEGENVISLLSGHLGGANELAREVAQLVGGRAVITTATDTAGVPAIDILAKEKNLSIANIEAVKSVNMALLSGESVQVFDPEDRLGIRNQKLAGFKIEWVENEDQWINGHAGVWVTWKNKEHDPGISQLILYPACLVAGIGCNRGTDWHEIFELIETTFRENSLALKSLKCLASIEAKRGEAGLTKAAEQLGLPLIFSDPSEIESIEVPHPSNVVKKHMGVSSVCEATALLKTGGGRLLVPKTKSLNATLAVALEI
jgi:cobalt-precorrin 5A hydrolase